MTIKLVKLIRFDQLLYTIVAPPADVAASRGCKDCIGCDGCDGDISCKITSKVGEYQRYLPI